MPNNNTEDWKGGAGEKEGVKERRSGESQGGGEGGKAAGRVGSMKRRKKRCDGEGVYGAMYEVYCLQGLEEEEDECMKEMEAR